MQENPEAAEGSKKKLIKPINSESKGTDSEPKRNTSQSPQPKESEKPQESVQKAAQPKSDEPQTLAEEKPVVNRTAETTVSVPDNISKIKSTPSFAGMGVSISSLRGKKEKTATTGINEEDKNTNGNNHFTEKELINAWNEFADNINEEKLLKNTMNLYQPKMISDVIFEVEVNTELNREYLNNNSRSILTFLREKVKNDDLTMTIKIAVGNAITKPLTSHEIFDEMTERNISIQKLSDEFGLELI